MAGLATRVVAVRHGETAWNAETRLQGQLDIPLNATGRRQAACTGRALAHEGIEAIWSSDLARARETAEIVAARLGLRPREDERWAETDAGDWTDRLFDDVIAEDPDGFAAFDALAPDFAFPGGESFAEQQERVVAAIDDIRAAGPLPALVVCHRNSIRLALERARGERLSLEDVPNGSLVAL